MAVNQFLRWMTSSTSSVYWHDSAIMEELDEAIGNGAAGVTTNPFLVNATLRDRPDFWRLQGVSSGSIPAGDDRAENLIRQVSSFIARKMAPFRTQGLGRGYVCCQLNPNRPGQDSLMMEQAVRYARLETNMVIKIPATRAGMAVMEECVARGWNVAATVSFTVPQVLAAGAAYQRGAARARDKGIEPGLGIAVVMVGRLDDYLRDVMYDSSSAATEADIIWAGTAVIKRAYDIFKERGYECFLMPAGCRGAYHISELAGADMLMSIAPKIAGQLALLDGPFAERIGHSVDPAIVGRLQTMSEFVKAYEPDGMKPEDFITFGSTNRTLTQFCDNGWNPLQTMSI
jgi:transaldolase